MVNNLVYCHIFLQQPFTSILLQIVLDTFTVFEILQINFGVGCFLISLTLCWMTYEKNHLTVPTLSDFCATKFKPHLQNLQQIATLLGVALVTGQSLKNTLVLVVFYHFYYEPLRRLSRARLTMKPPLLISTKGNLNVSNMFTSKD